MEGYTDRPAFGQRAARAVCDPKLRRTLPQYLPAYETITYGQAWGRIRRIAAALTHDGTVYVRGRHSSTWSCRISTVRPRPGWQSSMGALTRW